ncbi:trifunctional histidinol dehydrogenase [Malassezia yamatoensis]|uniref:Histidine biosynthesis trifunctional protein n=1 Tax=Malassezia yamatoensis TaxID=253288 RepID=A0AAJ6CHZ2_9BASI|nr:trifunctional histidinol dehydrogenase [Malassezia yamatoensis]
MLQQSSPLLPVLTPECASGWQQSTLGQAIDRSSPLLVPLELLEKLSIDDYSRNSILVQIENASYDTVLDLLNAGVQAVVVPATSPILEELSSEIRASRVILSVTEDSSAPQASEAAGVMVKCAGAPHAATAQRFLDMMKTKTCGRPVYLQSFIPVSLDEIRTVHQSGATAVVPTSQLSLDGSKVDYIDALLCAITSDRSDGLLPTVVVAQPLSTSLGLVYSSHESIRASLITGSAHYQSRKRGLWHKGETSGATQKVVRVLLDCDEDTVQFQVEQRAGDQAVGFCHLTDRASCFGSLRGLAKLEHTLRSRKANAPAGSYTARLFSDPSLLGAKIREEAQELVDATDATHVAFEAADLIYFALAKCIQSGIGLAQIEHSLDTKSMKVTRRKGDAKPAFASKTSSGSSSGSGSVPAAASGMPPPKQPMPVDESAPIRLPVFHLSETSAEKQVELLKRPGIRTNEVLERVRPILSAVKSRGDAALREYTSQLDRVQLSSNVRLPPFQTDANRAEMDVSVRQAIDVAYGNILRFHQAQGHVAAEVAPPANAPSSQWVPHAGLREVMEIETMPGVVCTRFPRAIERVGIYVPGGSAVLPSTALMLGVPAQVAGCKTIVLATPPRADGSIAPEVLYVADKVGVSCIVCAGGAQAVAAMAYGTETVPKVDKIAGPGNQYVTAAKMVVQNEVDALVSIDMPAGPSEVLVVADEHAQPSFVASDLLSQAEHGPDSQVVLVGINLSSDKLAAIEEAVETQARALPRVDVVRQAIDKSVTVLVANREEAIQWSNRYAPEHLILQCQDAEQLVPLVDNAGSVFVGAWSPESCGDYASGTNHTLPTYGYARQYSGVSTSTFQKHITAQKLDEAGLLKLGPHVVKLAECEGLEAHANAVRVRLQYLAEEK